MYLYHVLRLISGKSDGDGDSDIDVGVTSPEDDLRNIIDDITEARNDVYGKIDSLNGCVA